MQNENGNSQYDDNLEMYMKQIISELKKKDKYKNGLITHNIFTEVMDMFDIEYGTPTMNYLMQYCTVDEDGYVNYKKLLLAYDSSKIQKNSSYTMGNLINPQSEYKQETYENSEKYNKEKSDIIRQLYAHWDKCLLTDDEFKNMLINENVEITPEFERSLYLYGPSRSLSFVNVMKTLYINDCKYRKNRNSLIMNQTEENGMKQNIFEHNKQHLQDKERNPLAWVEQNVSNADDVIKGVNVIADYFLDKENCNLDKNIMSTDFFNATVKNLIKIYITNKIPKEEFYRCLNKLNIFVTPELNNLIKYHELDGTGKFKDFSTTISRSITNNMTS